MSSYWDIIVVLAIAAGILVALDWRITRAFVRHEQVEQQANALLAMTAETAAGAAQVSATHMRELRAETQVIRAKVSDLSEDVRMHDRRLGAVEERLMRAAMTVPANKHPAGDS